MRKTAFFLIALSPLSSLFAYSIFNARGLGGYVPPANFLEIQPRIETLLYANFDLGFVHSSEKRDVLNSNEGFIVRPSDFGFFFPLPGKFGLSLSACERFNLDFAAQSDSVHSSDYTLVRRIASRGGIESFRVSLDKSLFDMVYLGVGYERLFGGAWERWDSEILKFQDDTVVYREATVDSLLYHFRGNGFWGMAGLHFGNFNVSGFYGYLLDLKVLTEVQTERDTTFTDSAFYVPPAEMGGILSWTAPKFSLSAAFIQQTGGEPGNLLFVPGRTLEFNSSFALKPLTLTAKAGWMSWYTRTADSSSINDFYLGIGTRIPIVSFGYGNVELTGGLRTGGNITEYHAGLRLGLEFTEFWKKRERMWGG